MIREFSDAPTRVNHSGIERLFACVHQPIPLDSQRGIHHLTPAMPRLKTLQVQQRLGTAE
jgi:hypothetical protein